MSSRFVHLLAPGRIGKLEIRNRILMCPMGDCLAECDGSVSERQLAYYGARARGGAGMLLVGSASIAYPSGSYGAQQTALSRDEFLPGLRALTERVHGYGARIAAQLVHDGQRSLLDIAQGRPVLCASSPARPAPDRLSGMVTAEEIAAMTAPFTQPSSKFGVRVATADDLAAVVDSFAGAAARAREAGFDGVEIHAGHGYLIDDFLSPASNHRDDEWGGPIENRARLLLDVTRAARARVGNDFPIWFRINAHERFREHGESFADALRTIELAIAASADAVHVSAHADGNVAVGITRSHTPHEPNALLGFAAEVRRHVTVPVITFGRIEPDDAERAVAEGAADFVAMGRKLLADPDLPAKLAEDRVDDVRPCIYQYRCIGNIFLGASVACVANPATGRGDAAPLPTASPRRVLVIGGGPAGMHAATVLARRGHDVTLWEASARLGGRLVAAGRCDAPIDRFVGWLRHELDGSGVAVALGVEADPELVARGSFDEVIVATGARWSASPVSGFDLPLVHTIDTLGDWLAEDSDRVGRRVVVIGGGKAGLSLADLASRRGRDVTIVERSQVFGTELGLPGRFELVATLEERGVRFAPGLTIDRFEPDAVCLEGGDRIPADSILVALPGRPSDAVATNLASAGIVHRVIGDCRRVRMLEGALLDAADLAMSL